MRAYPSAAQREDSCERESIMASYRILVVAILLAASAAAVQSWPRAHDPGIRNDGLAGAGGPFPNLPHPLTQSFHSGQTTFEEVATAAAGLGPTMKLTSRAGPP